MKTPQTTEWKSRARQIRDDANDLQEKAFGTEDENPLHAIFRAADDLYEAIKDIEDPDR